MATTRRETLKLIGAGLALPAIGGKFALAQSSKPQIACVSKIGGIPWYAAMERGMKDAAEKLDVEAWLVGPTQADAAQQVTLVEDLIARKVSAICIVPNSIAALEPVCKRAIAAGIPVITHEAPSQNYGAWNFELISTKAMGEISMDALAKEMGEEGKYILFVGGLTVESHMKWADAAIAHQKAKYPKMEMLGDRYGVAESSDESYRTVLDVLRANPDLKGVITQGSQGPVGACRAIEERDKVAQIAVVGGGSPGQIARFLKSGSLRRGYIWSPINSGSGIVDLAVKALRQEPFTDGMEVMGVGKVAVDDQLRTVEGDQYLELNKTSIDELLAMGL